MGGIPHLCSIARNDVNIQLVTPAPLRINNGNRITAMRWAAILKKLGHRVRVTQSYEDSPCDALIALHARRSADSIRRFHELCPKRPLIVVLTGTDLYRDIRSDPKAKQSLDLATRLVVLQSMALRELRPHLRKKTEVIYQSADRVERPKAPAKGVFQVCVIAHLREEKDPLRTALAVRHLPAPSRIQVAHIGLALEEKLGVRARAEATGNPRYRWIGQLSHAKTRRFLAQSKIVCITSKMEGSSNVLSEALAAGVPVIASKIAGLMGTLGGRYAGYFPPRDTLKLRRLLLRAEADGRFYRQLQRHCARLKRLVQPERELEAWQRLLAGIERQERRAPRFSAYRPRGSSASPRVTRDMPASTTKTSARSNHHNRTSPRPTR
jgi:putative glycosyltransferase (TIGR04348 family)